VLLNERRVSAYQTGENGASAKKSTENGVEGTWPDWGETSFVRKRTLASQARTSSEPKQLLPIAPVATM